MYRIPCAKLTVFSKNDHWMRSVARMEQFSFQIKSRTSQQTWNILRALKLCAIYCQSCMEFLTVLGTTHWTDTITSAPKFGPLAQNSFWYWPNFVFHFFISFFEDRNFGVNRDRTLVDLLTFKCKAKILFYESSCATVIQPKAGVLRLLLCHGPFESLV